MENNTILCPLIDSEITMIECMENRDIKEKYIPDVFKNKSNWKSICKNCKYSKM